MTKINEASIPSDNTEYDPRKPCRDRYKFRDLEVGQRHIVRGADSHLAHNALNLFRKRNPELAHRRFRTRTLLTGCLVERTE